MSLSLAAATFKCGFELSVDCEHVFLGAFQGWQGGLILNLQASLQAHLAGSLLLQGALDVPLLQVECQNCEGMQQWLELCLVGRQQRPQSLWVCQYQADAVDASSASAAGRK